MASGTQAATGTYKIVDHKVIIKLRNRACETADELFSSDLCQEIIRRFVNDLVRRNSFLLGVFNDQPVNDASIHQLIETLKAMATLSTEEAVKRQPAAAGFLKNKNLFCDLVESLYNFWRQFGRFVICDSEGERFDKSPYRTFSNPAGHLNEFVRAVYRDIQEHVTQTHPRIYRQVTAGAEGGVIALPLSIPSPGGTYAKLDAIPVIRDIFLDPPLVLNPPMNKRKGRFERVQKNPLDLINLDRGEWLCYPCRVGSLIVLAYFHERFFELGISLCNLFDLADDEDLKNKPDAVFLFGVPGDTLDKMGAAYPTVFYDDEANGIMVGAVPGRDEFGYFGYAKKMILTLHNIRKMKKGKMPFHGALVRILLKGKKQATLLMIGDSGAGKSESLEAFRELGGEFIQDLIIIADDMGSLEINDRGEVMGYGTETGAFLRLDDLSPGYALGQIDRAIIMSANQVNARIILPVTTFANVIQGQKIDFVLYANNYEQIDEDHPLIERFKTAEQALHVFREGTVMSKGTTTTTGLTHSYFANIFGPVQYKDLHEQVAKRFFEAFFKSGVYIGQMRTRLGLAGWEHKGPEETAKELLKLIQSR